jgi:hypothetical protein
MDAKELREGINTGVLIAPPRPEDYIAGASPIVYSERLKDGQWDKYRPTRERQIGVYFDTMSCVTFAAMNKVEEQVTFLIETGALSGAPLKTLQDLGFFDENGKFNCSDRFIAILSGTTKFGNYLNAVWEAIRTYGLLPEKDLPGNLDSRIPWTFDDWLNPAVVTEEMKTKAKKVKEILQFAYEWIGADRESLKYHLKQAPVQIAAPVCPPWNTTEIIKACSAGAGHSTVVDGYVDNTELKCLDHYNPFDKRLAWNYQINAALKGIVELASKKLIDKVNMVMIKKAGESAVYAQVGDTLIPFFTNWEEYLAEYASAKIVELSAAEFAKFKVVATLGIKRK